MSQCCDCHREMLPGEPGKPKRILSYDSEGRYIGATTIYQCRKCAEAEMPETPGIPRDQKRLF